MLARAFQLLIVHVDLLINKFAANQSNLTEGERDAASATSTDADSSQQQLATPTSMAASKKCYKGCRQTSCRIAEYATLPT